jgi:hypothetical protein
MVGHPRVQYKCELSGSNGPSTTCPGIALQCQPADALRSTFTTMSGETLRLTIEGMDTL